RGSSHGSRLTLLRRGVERNARNRKWRLALRFGRRSLLAGGGCAPCLGVEQADARLLAALQTLLLERGGQPLVPQPDVPLRGIRHGGAKNTEIAASVKRPSPRGGRFRPQSGIRVRTTSRLTGVPLASTTRSQGKNPAFSTVMRCLPGGMATPRFVT